MHHADQHTRLSVVQSQSVGDVGEQYLESGTNPMSGSVAKTHECNWRVFTQTQPGKFLRKRQDLYLSTMHREMLL